MLFNMAAYERHGYQHYSITSISMFLNKLDYFYLRVLSHLSYRGRYLKRQETNDKKEGSSMKHYLVSMI